MTRRIRIPAGNWHLHLADAIEHATEGMVIIVSSDAQKQLAERASQRMGKSVVVEVEEEITTQDTCPTCGGHLQLLDGNSAFCLDCNWDNLEELPPERASEERRLRGRTFVGADVFVEVAPTGVRIGNGRHETIFVEIWLDGRAALFFTVMPGQIMQHPLVAQFRMQAFRIIIRNDETTLAEWRC